jgi:hypothetical protein
LHKVTSGARYQITWNCCFNKDFHNW